MGFAVAWVTRGNLVAAAIGTAIGNPWTFPLIFALTGQIGAFVLGQDVTAEVPVWDWDALAHAPLDYILSFLPIVFPLLVGGVPASIVVWILFYLAFKALIVRYREKRQARREAREANEDYKRRRAAVLAAQKGEKSER